MKCLFLKNRNIHFHAVYTTFILVEFMLLRYKTPAIYMPFLDINSFLRNIWETIPLFPMTLVEVASYMRTLRFETYPLSERNYSLCLVVKICIAKEREDYITSYRALLSLGLLSLCAWISQSQRAWFFDSRIQSMNIHRVYLVPGKVLGIGESKTKRQGQYPKGASSPVGTREAVCWHE